MNLDMSHMLAGIVFGSIGFGAFIYGKKQASFKPMFLGIALMGYSYFVSNVWVLWITGVILTVLLFF